MVIVGLVGGLVMIMLTFLSIYREVKEICKQARDNYGKECAESLVLMIESEKEPIKIKNKAIWALGQLAESKSLPFLYQLQKNLGETDRCKGGGLCKYEVEKAIKWCEQGNVTSWMYRKNFL